MLDLDRRVFGKITLKEIIGANPPEVPDTKEMLTTEFDILISELDTYPRLNLKDLLLYQKDSTMHVNSRPGAMALAQGKIRLFNEYNTKYMYIIEKILSEDHSHTDL